MTLFHLLPYVAVLSTCSEWLFDDDDDTRGRRLSTCLNNGGHLWEYNVRVLASTCSWWHMRMPEEWLHGCRRAAAQRSFRFNRVWGTGGGGYGTLERLPCVWFLILLSACCVADEVWNILYTYRLRTIFQICHMLPNYLSSYQRFLVFTVPEELLSVVRVRNELCKSASLYSAPT